jgi:hypothetical protein
MVSQTIGQQSSIGTATNPLVVQQGFQQSYWATLITNSTLSNSTQVIAYPNPFVGTIYFQFTNLVDEEISVLIYDIHGRKLLEKEIKVNNGLLSIDLSILANATYLVRFSTKGVTYYRKIIKNL